MLKAKKERLDKLTEEQRKIYDGWVREDSQINALTKKLMESARTATLEEVEEISNQLDDLIPSECEHGRLIWSGCMECDQIEKILFPELFNADGTRKDDEECARIAEEMENALKLN